MSLKLTTLCENTTTRIEFLGEWGLSILIEYKGEAVLLDTGLGDSLIPNSMRAGVDLNRINQVVISHGHKDHTGGMRAFLKAKAGTTEVIAHPDIWNKKYAMRPEVSGDQYHFVGFPFINEELEYLGARFNLSRNPVWLNEEMVTTGEVPLITSFEKVDRNLYLKTAQGMVPDPLMDDQALIIKTPKGLVVVLGCAHHGMINTLIRARQITGVENIYMVVGGTHLLRANKEQLDHTCSKLEEFGVERIGISHCTGMPAAVAIFERFTDNFFFNNAGTIIEV